jgi:Cu/Ag efflux protein CusF
MIPERRIDLNQKTGTLMSDPIDKLAMPASALAAMAKAVRTDALRDIARDNCPRAARPRP